MYDELIAELRQHHCDAKEDDTQEVCEECSYDVIIVDKSAPSGIASVCVCGLMNRAADAIEDLSKRVDESIPKDDAEIIIAEVAKPRWIPVTERLPEDRVPVLATYIGFRNGEKRSDLLAVRFEGMWCYWDGDPCSYDEIKVKITHWMSLPEPTKEEA